MKQKAIIVLSLLALAVSAFALAPLGGKFSQKDSLIRDTGTWIDANQILMFVTNKGSFAYDQGGLLGKNDGLYFPFTSLEDIADQSNNTSVIFAAGIWVGAVDAATGDTLVTIAEYADDWYPGPMIGTSFDPGSEFDVADRVYKLHADSLASNPNTDYTEWPVADGAPVDTLGAPAMLGDQMLWSVYNDANPAPHTNDASSTTGMGLEIRQTTFAFDRTDALANIVFVKYQIYNNGGLTLTDMFVSLWADPDLGNAGDDLVGSDTVLSLGYCYNEGNDSDYGSDPPAVGFDFFQGPLIFTNDSADTARMWDTTFVGFLNMGMTSFNKYINGTDPQNLTWTYQYMNGLDASIPPGVPLANGTKFFAPGDPTTGVGDIDFDASDRRYMLTTGPFDFAPGDSTEILAAIIVGQGGDRLSSISVLKFNDKFAQQAYDNNFNLLKAPANPVVTVHQLDGEIGLEWTDTSEVDPGDYPYQGYSIYQGISASATDPWTRIGNFDIIDGAAIIIDEVLDPLTGVVEQRAIKFGSDNGVQRYFGISNDIINAGPLRNSTEYFFKVEAYSYNSNPLATPKTQTSATIVRGTPQAPVAGTITDQSFADTIAVMHATGGSDGNVIPLVMDPLALTGDDYMVVFREDTLLGPVWDLINTTTGSTVLADQTNQSGDGDYPIVDGIFMKVAGPALAVNSFSWSGASRVLTGVDWGGSGFFGGLGLGVEFFGSSLAPGDHVTIEIRWVADGTGQNGYMYRRDDGYNYYGYYGNQDITVWDVTSVPERQVNFAFVENFNLADEDGQSSDSIWNGPANLGLSGTAPAALGGREYFFPLTTDYSATPMAQYEVDAAPFGFDAVFGLWAHSRGSSNGKPTPGDIFTLTPNFVNSVNDTFTFTSPAPSVATSGEEFLANINVAPNPYYLFGGYDASRTNRVLKFRNLPTKCTISIYNLAGDFIIAIEKDDPSTSEATWDITNDFNVPVASGLYIYVVDAPGFGQKIGKMAIFTEIEILGQY